MRAKKYELKNSYFKNKNHDMPSTILDIAIYLRENGELPFNYSGDNWVYDVFCERQKRCGVYHSQFLTPDATVDRMMIFAGKYFKNKYVCDACCGTGQITKELIKENYIVSAFDADSDMVSLCTELYKGVPFFYGSFKDVEGEYNQIISNPPYEVPVLTDFLNWILSVQNDGGISILLIPAGFVDKERPKKLMETLKRFTILEREPMMEEFARTKIKAEIVVLRKNGMIK